MPVIAFLGRLVLENRPGQLAAELGMSLDSGRADPARAEEALGHLVQRHVVRSDQVRIRANHQFGGVDAAGLESVDFLQQHGRVDDDAIADHGYDFWAENAAGQEMEGELLITNNYGVTRVVAALIADDVINTTSKEIGSFSFTFVSPLGAEQNDRRHVGRGYPSTQISPIRPVFSSH